MKTYFAPAKRSSDREIALDLDKISNNAIIDSLLASVGGLIAVLNEHRQILTVNQALLSELGIADAGRILGLRPGEALSCIHAHENEGGCGTSEACISCGAVIAIMASLETDTPSERICVLHAKHNQIDRDLYLTVRSCPITFANQRFVLLFLQDKTDEQRAAAVERAFFHDINNTLTALLGMSEVLKMEVTGTAAELSDSVCRISQRLFHEVRIQQCLHGENKTGWRCEVEEVSLEEMYADFSSVFQTHPAAKDRHLEIITGFSPHQTIKTDRILLMRILLNLLINAFEASAPGDTVRLSQTCTKTDIVFQVHNSGVIPAHLRARIFQRNFSTKAKLGRGLGTWSIKLFAEQYLNGRVWFETSNTGGLPSAHQGEGLSSAHQGEGLSSAHQGEGLSSAHQGGDHVFSLSSTVKDSRSLYVGISFSLALKISYYCVITLAFLSGTNSIDKPNQNRARPLTEESDKARVGALAGLAAPAR